MNFPMPPFLAPMRSRGSQKRGQNHKWLPHPYLLASQQVGGIAMSPLRSWGPPKEGTKSKVATSPLPSCRPTKGGNCYFSPVFSGVPKGGDEFKTGYAIPALSGPTSGWNCYENFVGSGARGSPEEGTNAGVAPSPLCSQVGTIATSPLRWVPERRDKIKGGYITPALWGADRWAKLLHHTCTLKGPQKRGQNHKRLHQPCLLQAHK